MPSTYSTSLRLELMATGEKDNTWGGITNTNLGTLLESAIAGVASVTHDDSANYTLTTNNGSDDEARHMIQEIGGTLTANRNVVVPTAEKLYFVSNATSGGFDITVKTSGGSGVTVANGAKQAVYCDGTDVVTAINTTGSGSEVTASSTTTFTNKTIDSANNTLTVDLSEATVTGTTSEFNTALSDDDFVTLTGTETVTNKTLTAPTLTGTVLISDELAHTGDIDNKVVFGTDTQDFQTGGSSRLDLSDSGMRLGGANSRVTAIRDEDDMISDSATSLATQQSIKAYVDTNGGITRASSQSPSAASTVDFTGIPSGISMIKVMVTDSSPLSTDDLLIQLGDSGGFETTGYESRGVRIDSAVADKTSATGFISPLGDNFFITGTLVHVDSNNWLWEATVFAGGGGSEVWQLAGQKQLTAELDSIRFATTGSDTITVNLINIFHQ